ncbi:MAG: hypothetical protein ACI4LP_01385 [Anaerovoracaceae bacterium]
MELKEAIGIVEYIRENEYRDCESEQFMEIRNILMEILFEMKAMNGKTENEEYKILPEDLPF